MSLFTVVLYNATNGEITFKNKEYPSDDQVVPAGGMFRTENHFNIPDCSGKQYFDKHHMEIVTANGDVAFSFFDDDYKDYDLYYCVGLQYDNRALMPGGAATGGNKRNIGIVFSGTPGSYQIQGRPVQNDV